MSDNFVKLYGSILDSSIWCEAAGTRLLWITMLAMADENGDVQASVGGLAKRAGISREECTTGLEVLLAPDPDDRSGVEEGRRLNVVPGGWHIINARLYREKRTADQIKAAEKVAAWRKKHREGGNSGLQELPVTDTDPNSPGYLLPMLPAEGEGEVEEEKKNPPTPLVRGSLSTLKRKKRAALPPQAPDTVPIPEVLQSEPRFAVAWLALLYERTKFGILTTEYAAKLQLRKLAEWATARGVAVAIEACELATAGGNGKPWQGVFEPEERKGSPARASVATPTTTKASLEVARRTLTAKAFSAWTAGALTTEQRDEITNAVERARSLEDLQGIAWPSRS